MESGPGLPQSRLSVSLTTNFAPDRDPQMTGQGVRETLAAAGVIASMVFVGMEIRQNTMVARAAAYQEIGFNAANQWMESAHNREYSEIMLLSQDSSRWSEIDEVGWYQLRSQMTSVMRGWETIYLQVEEGLLPVDGMTRLGYGVNYWPATLERLWPDVRVRLDADFAAYIEEQLDISR